MKKKKYLTPIPVYTLDASQTPYQFVEGFQGWRNRIWNNRLKKA
ncbi:hypothetical protein NXY28_23715 [Bacteroides thetaiotaomicron]|nr:hypothetical protein NXY28_23715 [Bacteroides thetaiotaomicron]